MASRAVFQLAHRDLKPGEDVCHRCDEPLCCNPAHLYAGSHRENMREYWRKYGRPGGRVRFSGKIPLPPRPQPPDLDP